MLDTVPDARDAYRVLVRGSPTRRVFPEPVPSYSGCVRGLIPRLTGRDFVWSICPDSAVSQPRAVRISVLASSCSSVPEVRPAAAAIAFVQHSARTRTRAAWVYFEGHGDVWAWPRREGGGQSVSRRRIAPHRAPLDGEATPPRGEGVGGEETRRHEKPSASRRSHPAVGDSDAFVFVAIPARSEARAAAATRRRVPSPRVIRKTPWFLDGI